ncbi:response regulator [Oharaeibacter diazotrophicus]|uniref:Response regulator receiver domain-containing protein n=1 Tax=Oharaeibacter diazotrophicus TaxID=1920512 RepID=A0A4R6RDM8_9HYPH|nr:response regulator [Oharaeibacter diazotrophicus]TDP84252.1 response regulator receiver domain-containing protein [Oharaeibacter diazotrophicus]BBE73289.1 aerobic respiration control protein ArcA [Pleomorphomonas sp. SM30]GLS75080.1 hypothetical protein GCM10007904_04150 [Oharaeibacter diazotrophicus]
MSETTDIPETVLVVEDDVIVRLVLADYLRLCGYRVFEATDGDEAMTVLGHPDWSVDVVLTALTPGNERPGFLLAERIRRVHAGVEVILARSPSGAVKAAGDLCERGPDHEKPYDPRLAVERIRLLRRGPTTRPFDRPAA